MQSKSRKKIKPKSRNKMQPKLKAGGIPFLNLHLIINGNHVPAGALIQVIIIVLSLINILMLILLVYG